MQKFLLNLISTLICSYIAIETAQCQVADNSTKATMIVKQPSVVMARTARGSKMGELYINSPVTVEKEDGEWVLVSLKSWVKKDGLGVTAVAQPTKTMIGQASTELVIESFSTKIVQDGLPEKRVYLTLKLKNKTAQVINAWKALLIAQSGETVYFREQISDDTKSIPAGQSIELNFYWEPSEPPYQHLYNANAESFKLELYQFIKEE